MTWESYPNDYRAAEVTAIEAAVRQGDSVSIIGLSGAGKSNLLGFLAHRRSREAHPLLLVDGNRLRERTPDALLRLTRRALGSTESTNDEWDALDGAIGARLMATESGLTLLLDRLDEVASDPTHVYLNTLRALRDAYKYHLTFVVGTRRPLPADSEFSELVLAHTLWLGPLSERDARWNVARYAARKGLSWGDTEAAALIRLSGAYPSFLRAACEALASGAPLDALATHPIVQARVAEFWADGPTEEQLEKSGLLHHPLLAAGSGNVIVDESELSAKEYLLLEYFRRHAGQVCEKEALIVAVWPEDRIYEDGVRDDSLAQLVRRLRQKIEPDPATPRFIETVRGRGYIFHEPSA